MGPPRNARQEVRNERGEQHARRATVQRATRVQIPRRAKRGLCALACGKTRARARGTSARRKLLPCAQVGGKREGRWGTPRSYLGRAPVRGRSRRGARGPDRQMRLPRNSFNTSPTALCAQPATSRRPSLSDYKLSRARARACRLASLPARPARRRPGPPAGPGAHRARRAMRCSRPNRVRAAQTLPRVP